MAFQLGGTRQSARRSRARTRSSPRRGRSWPAPSASSACAPRATHSLYDSDDAILRGARRRVAAGRRARDTRSAVPAVSRSARRDQVAARGSRGVPAQVCRRHRGISGAAAAGRGAAGAARAAEAQTRAGARRRHRASARRFGASSPSLDAATSVLARARTRARRRARARTSRPPTRCRAARRQTAQRLRRGAGTAARRARDGAHAVRGPVQRRAARRVRLERRRHRRGGILRVAESRRGAPTARADRLGRRVVAHHAGDQDARPRHRVTGFQRRGRSAAEHLGARD